ncbi:D-3-phosphoglycerate dehydrogenase [Thermosinus carboxydivorans Nor1]|uniref:D-3-phosphoglycerate dehydrogenase n=1 Tax=Thermosinus carboxydivorans Nor1 TaxID=401526 RepID=A1HUC3_9FIRM|nr:phosphoglycerate dehydrogenase [Thermosinus carboxydivorans]EAX46380.1 D-3-phosphoglycerate dehydrogenase [Thermosinus carboxydivorans Nor1]
MRILVADPVSAEGVKLLQQHFEVDIRHKLPPEELIRVIPAYDALVVRSETKVTKAVIDAAANLKVIGRAGVGVDNIDVEAATKRGIIVLNAPEGNTVAATEHTMAMMLALARNIPQAHATMKAGEWQRSKFMGVELRGKTLGILGLGRIGAGVAKRAMAMEMTVLAYDPFINADNAKALGVELVELDEVLAAADFLTLHLPLTPDTKGLLGQDAFKRMKRGVRIINCARGGIIDEAALAQALQDGTVAGAAIDVFEKEPVDPNNPLLGLNNVVLTPHLGASTAEAQVGVAVDVARGIIAALRGEPVTTAVNMAPIPPHVLEVIQPYFKVAEKMGCLAVHLADGRIGAVDVEYNGDISEVDTRLVTTAVIKGMLNPILQENVNYVNAPGIAKARGIKVKEIKSKETANFANLITVRVRTDKTVHMVAGTLFGKTEGRIVMIDGYRVDVDPQGWLLIGPHIDKPGMVGKVGTILGEHNINIAGMQVGRTEQAGTNIMVMAVESDIPTPVMLKIKAVDGILGAKLVNFNAG